MTRILIKKSFFYFHFLFFLFNFSAYAINDSIGKDITKLYAISLILFKDGNVSEAYNCLDSFFANYPINETDFNISYDTLVPIFNDYAYFAQMYYESQAKSFCNNPDETSYKDFLIFRSQVLQNAIDVLQLVVRLKPDRVVTYLNLADLLFEIDSDDEAEVNYKKYKKLMYSKGKMNIPKRVSHKSSRIKLYQCK